MNKKHTLGFAALLILFPAISHAQLVQGDAMIQAKLTQMTVQLKALEASLPKEAKAVTAQPKVLGASTQVCFTKASDTVMLKKIFDQEGITATSIRDAIKGYQLKYSDEILVKAGLERNAPTGTIGSFTLSHLAKKHPCASM